MDNRRHRRADLARYPAGRGRVVVARRDGGPPRTVDARDVEILDACASFRPLGAHAAALGGSEVLNRLGRLARLGLLDSPGELVAGGIQADPAPPVGTVAIPTRNRTELALQAAEHVADRLEGRECTVAVFDDSADRGRRGALVQGLAALGRRSGVRVAFCGPEDRASYATRLAEQAGLPEAVARYALGGAGHVAWRAGANRNAALLHSAGGALLSVDDDVRLCLALPPGAEPDRVRASSRRDPVAYWWSASPAAAIDEARFVDDHPLEIVARWLGHAPASGLDPDAAWWDDLDPAAARLLPRSRLRVLSFGGVGDAGMGNPHFALHLAPGSHARATASDAAWALARQGRGVLRAGTGVVASASSHLMTMAVALDHRVLLPPFPPVGRNADGVFGALVRRVLDTAWIGHLPHAVHHLPPESRGWSDDEVWAAPGRVELWEAYAWAAHGPDLAPETGPAERLDAIGRHLQELGEATDAAFEEFCAWHWRRRCAVLARQLHHRLDEHPDAPAGYLEDARRAREVLRRAATEPPVPVDVDAPAPREALRRTRSAVGRYGALLRHWPALRRAALALGDAGVRPARELT